MSMLEFETGEPLSPDEVKARIQALHNDQVMGVDDDKVDTLLFGATCPAMEVDFFVHDYFNNILESRYVDEKPWDGTSHKIWTPYEIIETVLPELNLTEDSTFYDLGAGYGRVPLYAGIVTPARCVGVEMVPERAQVGRETKEWLQLGNVDIRTGNVLDADFSDGDSFYMYSPFSGPTFRNVLTRLDQLAERRKATDKPPITLVARASLPLYDSLQHFQFEKSLLPRNVLYGTPDIAVFRSKK